MRGTTNVKRKERDLLDFWKETFVTQMLRVEMSMNHFYYRRNEGSLIGLLCDFFALTGDIDFYVSKIEKNLWFDWAQPFDNHALLSRRNKKQDWFFFHYARKLRAVVKKAPEKRIIALGKLLFCLSRNSRPNNNNLLSQSGEKTFQFVSWQ